MTAARPQARARLATVALAVVVAALAACGGDTVDRTSIVVQVDVDPALVAGTDFDRIVVTVSARGTTDIPFMIASRAALPVLLALLPAGNAKESFEVTAAARLGAAGADVVSQSARTTFLPATLGRVELFLSQSCAAMTCTADQTCLAGACTGIGHPATPIDGVAGAPSSDLKVQYLASDRSANTGGVQPHFTIVNGGNAGVSLADLTLRYWFTGDGTPVTPTPTCDYASVDCANTLLTFHPVAPPRFGADSYLEVGFSSAAGNIAAGGGQVLVQTRFNVPTFTFMFFQSNDFSFDPGKTAFADWPKVTLYRGGNLVWGVEP